ncbi:rhodanese-like domain-containing protein [Agromyces sp. H66]|uniref:rhodanese-like domain-containing protein n=1 Tax=Agromyces sp. H66 TaxID=2529859 RepID=UPI0010AB01CD|nr:rhodanese-like domain-containing protein [Agromyces sp. H66]
MKLLTRLLAPLAVAAAVVFGVAACAQTADPIEVASDTVVIDVRTPAEYAGGHLEGAINIDVQSPEFDSLVSELPTDGEYVVYCRSGNRSAAAIDRMEALGFTSLVNAGGVDAASNATGLAITK